MLWIMVSRSPWARWCLAAAITCAFVCATGSPACADSHADTLTAQTQNPDSAELSLSDLSYLPAAPLVPDVLPPDVLMPPAEFDTVRRTQTRVFTGDGFDACTAPSPKAMSVWWSKSPYRAVGVYIGGINRACPDGYLSNSWVHTVTAMGWRIVPIYVGRQAPRTRQKHLSPMSTRIVAVEADAAADDAVRRAAAFGIASGSAIYFDLESYSRKNAACANTVLTHLSAWTNRLHAHGYLAGVYSSAGSGITDLTHSTLRSIVRPDALWIARWDNARTVQDPAVPSDAWTHMRIKQLTGGHKESHGGVTINIDRDWLDGPVARIS